MKEKEKLQSQSWSDIISDFPRDIHSIVFEFLSKFDLLRFRKVSKCFREFIGNSKAKKCIEIQYSIEEYQEIHKTEESETNYYKSMFNLKELRKFIYYKDLERSFVGRDLFNFFKLKNIYFYLPKYQEYIPIENDSIRGNIITKSASRYIFLNDLDGVIDRFYLQFGNDECFCGEWPINSKEIKCSRNCVNYSQMIFLTNIGHCSSFFQRFSYHLFHESDLEFSFIYQNKLHFLVCVTMKESVSTIIAKFYYKIGEFKQISELKKLVSLEILFSEIPEKNQSRKIKWIYWIMARCIDFSLICIEIPSIFSYGKIQSREFFILLHKDDIPIQWQRIDIEFPHELTEYKTMRHESLIYNTKSTIILHLNTARFISDSSSTDQPQVFTLWWSENSRKVKASSSKSFE
jgi:hypothetical protein